MSHTKRSIRKYKTNRTNRILPFFGGLVLIGLAFLILRGKYTSQPSASIEVQGAPSLKADRGQVDFGDVKLGQTVEASFKLTNVGDQPLRFNKPPYIEVVQGC